MFSLDAMNTSLKDPPHRPSLFPFHSSLAPGPLRSSEALEAEVASDPRGSWRPLGYIKNFFLLCQAGRVLHMLLKGCGSKCPRMRTFGIPPSTLGQGVEPQQLNYPVSIFYSTLTHLWPPCSRVSFCPPSPCDSL